MKNFVTITNFLKKINNPKKTVFIGLGNVLKNDDGVGVYIIEKLITKCGRELNNGVKLFNVGVSLENYLNKIVLLMLEKIIFFDALSSKQDLKEKVKIISKQEIQNYTFSTHNVSLTTIIEYLQLHIKENIPEIYVVGIKGYNFDFGENITEEVKNTADIVVKQIYDWSNGKKL
ncbi:MAG: hydrogenase maturation protease [Endomicrobiia bacterium]